MIQARLTTEIPALSILYKDKAGQTTHRTIRAIGARYLLNKEPALVAWCEKRNALRMFGLHRTEVLAGSSLPELFDLIQHPLKRATMFDDVVKGLAPALPLSESAATCINDLSKTLHHDVSSLMVWWEGDTSWIDLDSKSWEHIYAQSGHAFFTLLSEVENLKETLKNKYGGTRKNGLVAGKRSSFIESTLFVKELP